MFDKKLEIAVGSSDLVVFDSRKKAIIYYIFYLLITYSSKNILQRYPSAVRIDIGDTLPFSLRCNGQAKQATAPLPIEYFFQRVTIKVHQIRH